MTQGGGGEKSSFRRWLNATRYAVAAAVTVLIMAVIVNAIKVVLRPDSLQLSVRGAVQAAAGGGPRRRAQPPGAEPQRRGPHVLPQHHRVPLRQQHAGVGVVEAWLRLHHPLQTPRHSRVPAGHGGLLAGCESEQEAGGAALLRLLVLLF